MYLNFFKEDGSLIKTLNLTGEKGKTSFQPNETGQYKICANYNGNNNDAIVVGIKIHSDNMDEPKLHAAIKTDDISPLNSKVNEIIGEGKAFMTHQNSEMDEEDYNAKLQMSASRNYYILTVVQVVVIIGLGLYQVFSFRKFLSTNNVI
jgi:heme/copper-type cytochrome/quinol oxidase subunit 2